MANDPDAGGPGFQKKKYPVDELMGRGSITIRLLDEIGQPGSALPYVLKIGHETIKGTSDDSGFIKRSIPKGADTGVLIIDGVEISISIQDMDPIDTIKGAQQRLKNLGYNPGTPDGILGPRTKDAIMRFQNSNPSLAANGEYDADTQQELLKAYGS